MDFQLSREQILLRDTTRDLLARRDGAARTGQTTAKEPESKSQLWKQLAEIGVLGLGFDPAESGQIEIMTVMMEFGRQLASVPLLEAALIPGALIAEHGTAEQQKIVTDVAEGRVTLAFAHTEPGMRHATPAVTTVAQLAGQSWVISGCKNPVVAGDSADRLVVTASMPEGGTGLFLVDSEAVSTTAYLTIDGRRGAQIDLDRVPATPLGATGDCTSAVERALIRLQSALCAEAVGAMEEALRLTTSYLTSRKQGSAARSGDSFGHAAWLAGALMMASNSTGVNRPRPACRRRRW